MTSGNAWSRRLGLVAATGVLLAGCGSSSAPSDAVPALGDSLDRVDDAIVDGRYDDARTELDELVGTTTSAREAGDLESSEAERILASAAEVMSALPAEEAEEPEDPEPSEPAEPAEPEPTSEPTPEDTEDGASEEEQKELEKEQEELEKEQEKLEKEAEKDADEGSENGNGGSSDNGPDDGGGS